MILDNKWLVHIAYTSDEKQRYLFGKNVKLRLMVLKTKAIKDVTPVFLEDKALLMFPPGVRIAKKSPSSATRLNKY